MYLPGKQFILLTATYYYSRSDRFYLTKCRYLSMRIIACCPLLYNLIQKQIFIDMSEGREKEKDTRPVSYVAYQMSFFSGLTTVSA